MFVLKTNHSQAFQSFQLVMFSFALDPLCPCSLNLKGQLGEKDLKIDPLSCRYCGGAK